jgi:hypothetical protein
MSSTQGTENEEIDMRTDKIKTAPPVIEVEAGGRQDIVVDIPYPLITEGAMTAPGGWPSYTPPGAADLGQTVETTLREVLSWRASGFQGDAKGFVAALTQSFSIRQVDGHNELTWTPRSYSSVQTGLGAITGAQASIYSRAKVALDQSLPLLAGLYPLRSDADPQNVDAVRAIVRSGLTELVNELGIEGGPRVLRADSLFRQLLGPAAVSSQQEPVDDGAFGLDEDKSQLGQLAGVFGLHRKKVNTIDEEQNLTNFLILVDYVRGLRQSWIAQREFFNRNPHSNPFLGTQLVLVQRALAVVAESVQEVYMSMDSVYLGQEERQVVELHYFDCDNNRSSLFVSELLSWIDQVAANEGPQLIRDGGRKGVLSFKDTIQELARLASGALITQQKEPKHLPAGYRTARVQRALQELSNHLHEASRLVHQIQ